KTCEEVAELLKVPLTTNVKSVMMVSDAGFCLLLVRADHSVNEVKIAKLPKLRNFRSATPEEIEAHLGVEPGYCGPVPAAGTHLRPILVIADRTVAAMSD